MFIGDLRRQLFIPVDHEWNGIVRDVTAQCETEGMEVNQTMVEDELASVYRKRATLALIRMHIADTVQ
jgi:hypothetical protein